MEQEKMYFKYVDGIGDETSITRSTMTEGCGIGFNLYDFGWYFIEFLKGIGYADEQIRQIINVDMVEEHFEGN